MIILYWVSYASLKLLVSVKWKTNSDNLLEKYFKPDLDELKNRYYDTNSLKTNNKICTRIKII